VGGYVQVIGEPSQAVTDGGVELHLGQKETITQITAGNAAVPHITSQKTGALQVAA
jgi:hypothetical protein